MRIDIPNRWIVLGLFGLCEGIMLWVFHDQDERTRATIVFGATVLAGGFALFTYQQSQEERRAQTAQAFIQRWNSPDMIPVRQVLREITENRLDPAVLMRAAKGDVTTGVDEKRGNVVMVLNFYEELAIAVLRKSANEDRLYDFFSGITQQSQAKLAAWITNERKVDNEPRYYSEFLKLCGRWQKRN